MIDRITALRERWRIELKECQDSLLDPPKAIPNPLDRMVVEYDYLLVETQLILKENARLIRASNSLLGLIDCLGGAWSLDDAGPDRKHPAELVNYPEYFDTLKDDAS